MRGRNVNTSRQFTNFPPVHQARLTKHYKTLVSQENFFGNKDELWVVVVVVLVAVMVAVVVVLVLVLVVVVVGKKRNIKKTIFTPLQLPAP